MHTLKSFSPQASSLNPAVICNIITTSKINVNINMNIHVSFQEGVCVIMRPGGGD